jgi:L-threonylcarbamoyladenylate synthase
MNTQEEVLNEAVDVLKDGGTVVYPTETAYGLGVDATNRAAVEKMYVTKRRNPQNTPGLIVSNFRMARSLAKIPRRLARLARNYWPGALTLVVPARPGTDLADNVIRENGTIALRISSDETARELTKRLGKPIVATSANVSGEPTCYTTSCVKRQFKTQDLRPDYYIEAGTLEERPPSTIVTQEDGQLRVLRAGPLEVQGNRIA